MQTVCPRTANPNIKNDTKQGVRTLNLRVKEEDDRGDEEGAGRAGSKVGEECLEQTWNLFAVYASGPKGAGSLMGCLENIGEATSSPLGE